MTGEILFNANVICLLDNDDFQFYRFGTYSIDQAINAGLDLEMPGINKLRTSENVGRSIVANKLTVRTIKERAKNVLELLQKCAKGAPEVRDGNPL